MLSTYPLDISTHWSIIPLLRGTGGLVLWGGGTEYRQRRRRALFSVFLRNKLRACFHHLTRNRQRPKLLAACFPGEQVRSRSAAVRAGSAGSELSSGGAEYAAAEITACDRASCCPGCRPVWIDRRLPGRWSSKNCPHYARRWRCQCSSALGSRISASMRSPPLERPS